MPKWVREAKEDTQTRAVGMGMGWLKLERPGEIFSHVLEDR
ncbi:MAG: hypothetical protein AAFU79_30640 [Myxococcota bacterium]